MLLATLAAAALTKRPQPNSQTVAERPPEPGRHRRLVSQVLIAGLIAVAYSEPVNPVTHVFDMRKGGGVNIQSLAWLAIYVLTVLRFFIGNIVHLENDDLGRADAIFRWFWDMCFVVLECVILIFAGSVTTLKTSATAHISFTDYLLILYGVDVTWLGSIQVMSWLGKKNRIRFFHSMERHGDMAPFEWAVVNIILAVATVGLGLLGHPSHIPIWKLYVLVGANFVIFLWDVVKIAYGIREREA
jgi:hypothetical protein